MKYKFIINLLCIILLGCEANQENEILDITLPHTKEIILLDPNSKEKSTKIFMDHKEIKSLVNEIRNADRELLMRVKTPKEQALETYILQFITPGFVVPVEYMDTGVLIVPYEKAGGTKAYKIELDHEIKEILNNQIETLIEN